MAANILHSLSDDNVDMQKQIGCMTGVFQLFDRNQIVAGRRLSDYGPKKVPNGSPHFGYGTPERESSNSYHKPYITEKYSNKIVQDKNRISTESSRDSFSSLSRSSSFSSVDCSINKTTHQDSDHIVFPVTHSRDTLTRHSRQSVDLRDVVKDSMYRHNPTVKDDATDRMMDYRESLAKFQEASWHYNESRELSRSKSYQLRDGSLLSLPKDCPRFSYDGQETNRLRNLKSNYVISTNRGPIQSRSPSVVAKLMGLEVFPDSSSTNPKKSELGPVRTSGVKDLNTFGPIKMHTSPRISPREPTSPLWRNSDMKSISCCSVEPAPWKQWDGAGSPHRPFSRAVRSPSTIHSPFSSVYSEVDERLKDLEFTESEKDLRDLKRILEAMRSMENRKEGTQSMVKQQPIVIIKPAKLVERFSMPTDDRSFRNNNPKSTCRKNAGHATEVRSVGRHTSTATGLTKQGKSSGSISPRVPQKRAELDRRSRPPTPQVDSSKLTKQSDKQVSGSTSLGGRRSKYSNNRQNDGHHCDVKGGLKKLSYRETRVSHEVVNIPGFSEETDNMQSPISIQEKSTLLGPEYPSPVSVLDDGVFMEDSPSPVKHKLKKLKGNSLDQTHTRIEFTDDTDQGIKDQWQAPDGAIPDTLSSGITSAINRKKLQDIDHLVQKLTRLSSGHDEAQTDYIASLCENTKLDDMYISDILLASGLLLRDLGSNLTDFQFHSSGHPINPELFLVLEQTKFSTLTKKDPNETKKTNKMEKNHRKLIFDAVNEILAGKLALSVPFQTSSKLVKRMCNAQKLLRDLCMEIEQLQVMKKKEEISLEEEDDGLKSVLWEEVLNHDASWTDYDGEIPVITLEVERLIFKDLVNEVVLGEAADGRRVKPGRCCRQLFSK